MENLESQSKKYFFVLLFVLMLPNVVLFLFGMFRGANGSWKSDHYFLLQQCSLYLGRFVLAYFLFHDLKNKAQTKLSVLILILAFVSPYIATIIYFIAANFLHQTTD